MVVQRKVPQKKNLTYEDENGKLIPVVSLIGGSGHLDRAGARVEIVGPTSAFGELVVVTPKPFAALRFDNGILSQKAMVELSGSGSITTSAGLAVVSSGATAGSVARVCSTEIVRYTPGQGIEARFSFLFSAGVAGTTQAVGLGDCENAVAIGMNGTTLAMLRRSGGQREIRELTVSGAATGAGSITITLDGGAGVTVPISGAMSIGEVAREIADADYSGESGGWTTAYGGGSVSFRAVDTDTRSGAYTFGAGATGAAASFAQTAAAVQATDTWVDAVDFSSDSADGTGALPAIDVTKGQVGKASFQWLGFGMLEIRIENPATGEFSPVHSVEYANANTVPSVSQPNMPIMVEVDNGATAADVTARSASIAVFVLGDIVSNGPRYGHEATATIGTTETPILALRLSETDLTGDTARVRAFVDEISLGTESGKITTFRGLLNPTLVGAPTWTAVAAESLMSTSEDATSITGGTLVFVDVLGGIDGHEHRPAGGHVVMSPGDILVITGKVSSGVASAMLVTPVWTEDF